MKNSKPIYNETRVVLEMLGFKNYLLNNSINCVIREYADVLTAESLIIKTFENSIEFMVYSDTIALILVNQTEVGSNSFLKILQII